ncbi:MAG: 1-acyl-sn-glycerol-3-phosphate acyltransferase [Oscillospiraceae bacterium]|nr:1-acyl-sn-glycerol-3-phosphate acyltransferase [Oscillospiraceae bacterium]
MVLHVIYLLLAFLAAAVGGIGWIQRPGQWWIPIVLFVGVLLGLWLLHILVIASGSLFVDSKKRPNSVHTLARRVSVATLDTFLAVCGVRCTVKGREKLPDSPFLMVVNHLSLADPLAVMVQFRKQDVAFISKNKSKICFKFFNVCINTFISKKEINKLPAIRRYMPACGCLFLDREDSRSAIYTIREAAEHISSGLCSMAICPEGTRNKTDAPVLPFHAGSFKIATKAGCPLVIAGIYGTDKLFHNFPLRRTGVELEILETLPADEVSAARSTDLAKYAEETIGNWVLGKRKAQ